MEITRKEGRACLLAMKKIAAGFHTTKTIEHDRASDCVPDALHALGWCDREPNDYFAYTRKMRDGLAEYRPDQVLMALALCVTLSKEKQ